MDNQLRVITILTGFIIIGLCCAGLIVAGPVYLPRLPARAAQPIPTITPAPTTTLRPSPEPTPTIDNRQYLTTARDELAIIALSLGALGELLEDPQLTDSWATSFANQVIAIQTAHQTLTGLTPPADLQWLHENLIDGTADCNSATIRMMDNELDQAERLIDQCGKKIGPVAQQIGEMLD